MNHQPLYPSFAGLLIRAIFIAAITALMMWLLRGIEAHSFIGLSVSALAFGIIMAALHPVIKVAAQTTVVASFVALVAVGMVVAAFSIAVVPGVKLLIPWSLIPLSLVSSLATHCIDKFMQHMNCRKRE